MRRITIAGDGALAVGIGWAGVPSCCGERKPPSLCCQVLSEDCEFEVECRGAPRDGCWPCGAELYGSDSGVLWVGENEDRAALEKALALRRQMACGYYDLAGDDPERVRLARLLQSCDIWREEE